MDTDVAAAVALLAEAQAAHEAAKTRKAETHAAHMAATAAESQAEAAFADAQRQFLKTLRESGVAAD